MCCFCGKLLTAPAGGMTDELARAELEAKINSSEIYFLRFEFPLLLMALFAFVSR